MKNHKAPAFQFYVKDWLSDTRLRQATPAARGIWIDCLCHMWEDDRCGKLEGKRADIMRMLGLNEAELSHFLTDAQRLGFADIQNCNGDVTIINRRMHKPWKAKEDARLRQERSRQKRKGHTTCHNDVTPYSPSPFPIPTPEEEEKERADTVVPEQENNAPPPSPSYSSSEEDLTKSETESTEKGHEPEFNFLTKAQIVVDEWESEAANNAKMIHCDLLDGRTQMIMAAVLKDFRLEDVLGAVRNYSVVLKGDEYWWSRSYPLADWLDKGIHKWLDSANPLEEFLDKVKAGKRRAEAAKKADQEQAARVRRNQAAKPRGSTEPEPIKELVKEQTIEELERNLKFWRRIGTQTAGYKYAQENLEKFKKEHSTTGDRGK